MKKKTFVRTFFPEDIGPTGQVVARCFKDDPMAKLQLRGIERHQEFILGGAFTAQIEHYIRTGHVYVLDNLLGLSAVVPSENDGIFGMLGIGLQTQKLVRALNKLERKQMMSNAKMAANCMNLKWRKEYKPYYYLSLLAVDPAMKHTGACRALLAPILRRADRTGRPLLLDTNNPRNIPIYQHFGFQLVHVFGTGPVWQYCMVRMPEPYINHH